MGDRIKKVGLYPRDEPRMLLVKTTKGSFSVHFNGDHRRGIEVFEDSPPDPNVDRIVYRKGKKRG